MEDSYIANHLTKYTGSACLTIYLINRTGNTQGPHSHILMMGGWGKGGEWGVRVIFFGLKFCPKVIFLGL